MIELKVLDQSDERVATYLEGRGEGIMRSLATAMQQQMAALRTYVVANKLSGGVLNIRTGNLASATQASVDEDASIVTGKVSVSANVKYAAYQEFGFQGTENVRAHTRITNRGNLANVREHTRNVNYPAHSYLRSSLAEQKDAIVAALAAGVQKAVSA